MWVESHTVKKTPHTTRNSFPVSDRPNQRITIGTNAIGGIGRRMWNSGDSRLETIGN